ncbi:MAG: MOSC domain-containing protein [Rubrobacteraceae bacterium]
MKSFREYSDPDTCTPGARLVSLNVGMPQPLDHRGQDVQSGIFKTPVEGALWIDEIRLEGDDQADKIGHGGPNRRVCVHPLENFPYWAGRIGQPLKHGAFGENFTTEGLVESEVIIGDVYRVGTSVLQVSQPRTPCFKLAARYGVKQLAGWFAQTGLTGFYLRLPEAGKFQTDDTISLLDRPLHGVTVLETNRVMYRDRRDFAALERLLSVPELSVPWLETFEERLIKAS